MFFQKGGEKRVVGEGFLCHLPPVPSKEFIIGYNKPREEQFWQRQGLPSFYKDRALEEEYKRSQEREAFLAGKRKFLFVDPVLERYRRQEFHRRVFGAWFMNDGEPTYLTGDHYFYLNWSKFDHKENGGYPFYYEFSRDNFYIRQWCEENPRSLGYMIIGPRGNGKSSEEISGIINRATIRHSHRAVLQSNDFELGSKKVLIVEKSIPLFNELPKFFKPEYSHGTNAQEEMIFRRKSSSGKAAANMEFGPDEELMSSIVAVRPGELVLDKATIEDLYEDEIGKCIGPETKVLLHDGRIKEAKDVSISDQLMGPDSKPRKIKEIKTGLDTSYKIIPKKGWEPWTCSSGHKLVLNYGNNGFYFNWNGRKYKGGDTVIMTIDSYLKLNKTNKKHLTLMKVPIEYDFKRTYIDPYLLGLWLGDGHKANMTITNIDPEIINHLMTTYNGIARYVVPKKRTPNVRIKTFHGLLRHYGLKKNKHIPKDYLVNDRKSRLQLLAGLIDSDGHATIKGNRQNCEITQKNERLAKDIHRLATELGFYCSMAIKKATMRRKDGTMYVCDVYRLNLFGDLCDVPTKVPRKQFPRIEKHHKSRRDPLKCGFTVEPIGFQEYVGFVIDGDRQHLLGDCQVTHNTDPSIADIVVRHGVNKECVWRNSRKIGMMRKTSTVVEMKKGGGPCLKLWKMSDPKILDNNGFTTSKIHRHLINALDTDTSLESYTDESTGMFYPAACNKYGKVDRKIANMKIQNDLDAVKHDIAEQSNRMRQRPRNESEAFIPDQSRSIFNIQKITARLHHLLHEIPKPLYIKGNFYWVKDRFGEVWFAPDSTTGRFNICWFPDEYKDGFRGEGERKIINNWEKKWGYDRNGDSRLLVVPKNDHLFRAATDPIKYVFTKDPRASKAAIHIFRCYDHMVDGAKKSRKDWETEKFILEYCYRPDNPATYLEDLAMACMFFGCKVFPERNIPDVNYFFETNGLQELLAYPKDWIQGEDTTLPIQVSKNKNSEDAGMASSKPVIDYYTKRLIPYINEDIDRVDFDQTLEDWSQFDPLDPTKSHLTVSSGFALVHNEKITEVQKPIEANISDWFQTKNEAVAPFLR